MADKTECPNNWTNIKQTENPGISTYNIYVNTSEGHSLGVNNPSFCAVQGSSMCPGNEKWVHTVTGCMNYDGVYYNPNYPELGDIIKADDVNKLMSTLQAESNRRKETWSYSSVSVGNVVRTSDINQGGSNPYNGGYYETVSVGELIQSHHITNAANAVFAYGRECLCNCDYCACDCDHCTCNCNNCNCHSHY